jgi:mannose-6-phosphate isomerase-like protein (cupin superfamily)
MVTEKPWGKEELLHQGHGYAVKRITLLSGHRTSLHYHAVKHEHIYILSGNLQLTLEVSGSRSQRTFVPGEYIAIEPSVIHQMASGDATCVYLESQSDHLDDVIRVQDDYNR